MIIPGLTHKEFVALGGIARLRMMTSGERNSEAIEIIKAQLCLNLKGVLVKISSSG